MHTDVRRFAAVFFFMAVFVMAMAASPQAFAQEKIAIVNIQKIMSDSAAAKSIQTQLEKYRKTFQDEFSKYEKDLQAQEKKLLEERSKLAAEEFNKKRQEFEAKLLDTRKLAQKRQRSLETGADAALDELRKAVLKIVGDMSAKEGYTLVLSRQMVVTARDDMDITDAVMKQLDKSLKEVALKVETN